MDRRAARPSFIPRDISRKLSSRLTYGFLAVATTLIPAGVGRAQTIPDVSLDQPSQSPIIQLRFSGRLCPDQVVKSDNEQVTGEDLDAISDILVNYSGFGFPGNRGLYPFLQNLNLDDLSKPGVMLRKYPHKYHKRAYGYALSVNAPLLQGIDSQAPADFESSITYFPDGDEFTDQPTALLLYQLITDGQLSTLAPDNRITRDGYDQNQLSEIADIALTNPPWWRGVTSGPDRGSIAGEQLEPLFSAHISYNISRTLAGRTRISLI